MEKNRNLNLKGMVQAYIDFHCDEELWKAFYTMYATGFISSETWGAFSKKCSSWYMRDDGLYDDNKKIMMFDENGFLKAVE